GGPVLSVSDHDVPSHSHVSPSKPKALPKRTVRPRIASNAMARPSRSPGGEVGVFDRIVQFVPSHSQVSANGVPPLEPPYRTVFPRMASYASAIPARALG